MGSSKKRKERALKRFEHKQRCEFDLKHIEDMPFTCKFCEKTFCTDHRLPEKHNCIGLKEINEKKYFTNIIDNINDIADFNNEVRCKECNNIIKEIPFRCKDCEELFCYEHRSPYNHNCN